MINFTKEELRGFAEKSLANMLDYYEQEMRRINRGVSASELITGPLISRFVESGILERGKNAGLGGWRLILSRKARDFYGLP